MSRFAVRFAIAKSSKSGRYVAGWASVIEKDGVPVIDTEGDRIDMPDLVRAAHNHILKHRVAKAMHEGKQLGHVVESVIIDDDFAHAHGIVHKKRGWWIKMDIADQNTRERVRKGELKAFSIGGEGKRTPIGEGVAKRAVRIPNLAKRRLARVVRRVERRGAR